VGPATRIVDVVLAAIVFVGVKPADALHESPALKVAPMPASSSDAPASTVKRESAGGASVKLAGAFPTFVSVNPISGVGVPTSVDGKASVVGDPCAKASVAPVGVAETGMLTLV